MPSLWWPAVRPPTAYRAALPFRSPQSALRNLQSEFRISTLFPFPALPLREVWLRLALHVSPPSAVFFRHSSFSCSAHTPSAQSTTLVTARARYRNAHRARSPLLIVQMYRLLQTGLDWNLGGFGRGGDPGQWSADFRARHASAVCDIRTPPYVLVNRHS